MPDLSANVSVGVKTELSKPSKVSKSPKYGFDIKNVLEMKEKDFPVFTLAKNKARFFRMFTWYKNKNAWLSVAPLSSVKKMFKEQTKGLEGIRENKMDYEMDLEQGTLTPSQRSYRLDELNMCKIHEKMAVYLISSMQKKIKISQH